MYNKLIMLIPVFIFIKISLFASNYPSSDGYNNCNMQNNGELLFLQKSLVGNKPLIIFDIGANIGEWSKEVLKINPYVEIYAFEPNPTTYKSLVGNNRHLQNIHPFQIGLSNKKNTTMNFYCYGDTKPAHSILDGLYNRPVLQKLLKKKPNKITITITTLDDFCEKHSIHHIDLLKIDTEGEEYNILLGASKLLDTVFIPMIQFEYGGCYVDSKTNLKDVYTFLTDKNYQIYRLTPTGKIHIPTWNPQLENYTYCNYVAIKE